MAIHRVFVSSTYSDLLDYRQAVSEAVRGLDLQADDMIMWSADDRSAPVQSVDRVKQADVLILLVAHRYGTIPEGEQFSVTELEYLAAREAHVPVLAFFIDEEVPWPPQLIDWDSKDHLQRFKERVEREVTRKSFRSPQELAFRATQALAHLLSKADEIRSARRSMKWFARAARPVSTSSRLLSEPDVLVSIGTAEDGLPLCLEVTRSRDLSQPFQQLREAISSQNRPAPDDMLSAFRKSLVDYATRSWASQNLHEVRLCSGVDRLLYVTPFTLSGPFSSVLSGFLCAPLGQVHSTAPPTGSRPPFYSISRAFSNEQQGSTDLPGSQRLQSTGGQNRFLGIDPENGSIYSVGWHNGRLIEWRPFLCESVLSSLPNTRLVLRRKSSDYRNGEYYYTENVCPVGQASESILNIVDGTTIRSRGHISIRTALYTTRHELMLVLAEVADELAALHENGIVHGDIKPDNVLLTKDGVALIDSFEVPIGDRSPGWTPNWSAPEQTRGEPVTPAADIYPLAVMAAKALGAQVVGEVRKYRIPRSLQASREVDLFHNPSLFVNDEEPSVSRRAFVAWRDLIKKSLSFDPDKRPAAAEFAKELRDLTDRHRISGRLLLRPTGELTAVRFVDGRVVVARVISEHSRRRTAASQTTNGRMIDWL